MRRDPLGLWGKKGHTDLTRKAFQSNRDAFSDDDIAIIVEANTNVDLWYPFINPAHYMPGTRDEAEALISHSLQRAIEQELAGKHSDAMKSLGQCLHTAQDRFSHFEQNAGWYEHSPYRSDPDPDNPGRHPDEYTRARNFSESIIGIFLNEISR